MAVLDDYDGAGLSFAVTFHPTGGRIPLPPGAHIAVTGVPTVRQQYTLAAPLPVSFLPALDRPVGVGGLQVAANAATGMLLLASHTNDGALTSLAGFSLRRTVAPGQCFTADGIGEPAGQNPTSSGAIFAADVTLPPENHHGDRRGHEVSDQPHRPTPGADRRLPAERDDEPACRRTANRSSSRSSVISEWHWDIFKGHGQKGNRVGLDYHPASTRRRGGHGRDVTVGGHQRRHHRSGCHPRTVRNPRHGGPLPRRPRPGGHRLPDRGVDPVPGLVAPGAHQVTDRQAWTWVEIPVAGLGWVVADPTPDARTAASTPPPEAVSATATTLPSPPANAVPAGGVKGAHALAKRASIKISRPFQLVWWAVVLLVMAGLLLIVGLFGPGLAGARRLRRRWSRRCEGAFAAQQ